MANLGLKGLGFAPKKRSVIIYSFHAENVLCIGPQPHYSISQMLSLAYFFYSSCCGGHHHLVSINSIQVFGWWLPANFYCVCCANYVIQYFQPE